MALKQTVTMSADDLIAFRNQGLAKKTANLQSNNLKGTAIGYLGLHYSRKDVNVYLAGATSEIIAIALATAGHITMTERQFDGKMVFSTLTDGKTDDERTMLPAADVQRLVEDYCTRENITSEGEPLASAEGTSSKDAEIAALRAALAAAETK